MSKVQEMGEEFAWRSAVRFVSGLPWSFDYLLTLKDTDITGVDKELLELYTLVLMPVALVYSQTRKSI
jgi:hypothetical protein